MTDGMSEPAMRLWAKTGDGDPGWHPLLLHLLDVAGSADAILEREPDTTRRRVGTILGMSWEDARGWLRLAVACHDLGKACPGFQCKWQNMTGLNPGRSPNTEVNHAYASQIALAEFLRESGWPEELADGVADAVGCHHGERASPMRLDRLGGDRRALGGEPWAEVRRQLMKTLLSVFRPPNVPTKPALSGPDFMLLSGLTSFADWIGSIELWFPFGMPEDCRDPEAWFHERREGAARALDAIGWRPRTPLVSTSRSFEELFGVPPRPMQETMAQALAEAESPAVFLVEAPMGEGKTEAAFQAHVELQRRFGHRGLYVALPTKATGNAMFKRTLDFLRAQRADRTLDLQLVHGAALLNDTFQDLHPSGVHDPDLGGEVRAGEWFTHKKRALLTEYGVGTVDQALLPVLPVRHQFVRLWGLANRVVVFDEIHAYDAYTGSLLLHLLRWLLALGSSVVLLSATLPRSIRRKLAQTVGAELPDGEEPYPRLSVFSTGAGVQQRRFEADPKRRRALRLLGVSPELSTIRSELEGRLAQGGMALVLLNTVRRAQELYLLLPEGERLEREGQRLGKRLSDGTEVYLFHARFPANRRQSREDHVLATFGGKASREGRKILIATQVAEQSLDLDFDLMVTDLAPIDLVLQRAGRLWRHERGTRPLPEPTLLVAGLDGEEPPSFGKPLWWGGDLYREDLLLRTWSLLKEGQKQTLTLPDDIDAMVQAVYEGEVDVPAAIQARLGKAEEESDGKALAYKSLASQAIIGFPEDGSWNQPERFVLYDEDEPGVHRTLMAQTRLGDDSVVAIPLTAEDGFTPEVTPDIRQARAWFLRSVSLSRKGVVTKLRAPGVPEGWKKSPLLRNSFPFVLGPDGRWAEDPTMRLDDDLGIVYGAKEEG